MLAIKKECWLLPRLDGIKTLHNEPSTSKAVRRANTKEQEGKKKKASPLPPPSPPACHRLQKERKGGNKGGRRKPTPEEQSGFLSPLFIKSLSFLRRCSSAFPLWRDRKPPPPVPEQKMAPGQGCDREPETKKGSNSKMGPGKRERTDN